MSNAGAEKRREQRRQASGVVRVWQNDSQLAPNGSKQIEGRLIDISPSGFRMAHRDLSLEAGQVVEFSHGEAMGTARVMWNRIMDRTVETGFFVVNRD
jgi:hypothetical protein